MPNDLGEQEEELEEYDEEETEVSKCVSQSEFEPSEDEALDEWSQVELVSRPKKHRKQTASLKIKKRRFSTHEGVNNNLREYSTELNDMR